MKNALRAESQSLRDVSSAAAEKIVGKAFQRFKNTAVFIAATSGQNPGQHSLIVGIGGPQSSDQVSETPLATLEQQLINVTRAPCSIISERREAVDDD